nr:integrase core domain-containing protein [Bradyrhizobium yuanmingense]
MRIAARAPSCALDYCKFDSATQQFCGRVALDPSGGGNGIFANPRYRPDLGGRSRPLDGRHVHQKLWRSLKHEDVYLKFYADRKELHAGLADWIAFYNEERPHQAHGYRTPMAVWRAGATAKAVDMVDNAEGALPTCPQPQQQAQTEALAA